MLDLLVIVLLVALLIGWGILLTFLIYWMTE